MKFIFKVLIIYFKLTVLIECLGVDRTSVVKRQASCSSDEYKCKNGQCISSFTVCDGIRNCMDGTDETQSICSKLKIQCPSYAFRCAYGACVDRDSKCNGVQDCADNSDELLSECRTTVNEVSNKCGNEFECDNGQCIPQYSVCDGISECSDGSDETITQCVNIRCPSYTFQCAYGACIDKDQECNGVKNCHDGSDENEENCRNIKPSSSSTTTTTRTTTKKPSRRTTTPRTTTSRTTTSRTTTSRTTKPTTTPVPESGSCVLPEIDEGTRYKIKNCQRNDWSPRCQGEPGAIANQGDILNVTCSRGYALPDRVFNRVFCDDGNWTPGFMNCQRLCKPLISDSVVVRCTYRGEEISCNSPMLPGTKMEPRCKPKYSISNAGSNFLESVCDSNGEWTSNLYQCVPDCGLQNHEAKPLIAYGELTQPREYPWVAGLYKAKADVFDHICGGTIISPRIILTAAHCVFRDTTHKKISEKDLVVSVGKFFRSWDIKDPDEQRHNVKEIILQKEYTGQQNQYTLDIALLDLESLIVLSAAVLPVCMDYTSKNFVRSGTLGHAAGWGKTEHGEPSAFLLNVKIPYIPFEECKAISPVNFRSFITFDKFCAGYENGTGVGEGDSGGGLTFVFDELHFVYGIVSVKPQDINKFAAFTNVSTHILWINNVLNAIKQRDTNSLRTLI